jgi:lysozyme
MNISNDGLQLIKTSEGFRATVYLDVAGFPTIGYGHKLLHPESYPHGVTEDEATALLIKDVQSAEQAVSRLVKVVISQGIFDALVDFTFNLGSGRLAASTLLKVLNVGHYDDARGQLLLWDRAGGNVCSALLTRRQAEAALWGDSPQQA